MMSLPVPPTIVSLPLPPVIVLVPDAGVEEVVVIVERDVVAVGEPMNSSNVPSRVTTSHAFAESTSCGWPALQVEVDRDADGGDREIEGVNRGPAHHEGIGAGIDEEQVVAGAADERVVALVRDQRVVAAAADQAVCPGSGDQQVVARAGHRAFHCCRSRRARRGRSSALASTTSFEPSISAITWSAAAVGVVETTLPPVETVMPVGVITTVAGLGDQRRSATLSLPVPPSLSVAVAVATSTPIGLGTANENVGRRRRGNHAAVLDERPGQRRGAGDARVGDDAGQADRARSRHFRRFRS